MSEKIIFVDNEVLELVLDELEKGPFEEVKKDDLYRAYEEVCERRFVWPRDRRIFFRQLRQLLGPGYRQERRRIGRRREFWLIGIGFRQAKMS